MSALRKLCERGYVRRCRASRLRSLRRRGMGGEVTQRFGGGGGTCVGKGGCALIVSEGIGFGVCDRRDGEEGYFDEAVW